MIAARARGFDQSVDGACVNQMRVRDENEYRPLAKCKLARASVQREKSQSGIETIPLSSEEALEELRLLQWPLMTVMTVSDELGWSLKQTRRVLEKLAARGHLVSQKGVGYRWPAAIEHVDLHKKAERMAGTAATFTAQEWSPAMDERVG